MDDPTPSAIEAALVAAEAIVKRSWERTAIARHEPRFPIDHWAGSWWHCGWVMAKDPYGWFTINIWLDPITGERRLMKSGAPDDIEFTP